MPLSKTLAAAALVSGRKFSEINSIVGLISILPPAFIFLFFTQLIKRSLVS